MPAQPTHNAPALTRKQDHSLLAQIHCLKRAETPVLIHEITEYAHRVLPNIPAKYPAIYFCLKCQHILEKFD